MSEYTKDSIKYKVIHGLIIFCGFNLGVYIVNGGDISLLLALAPLPIATLILLSILIKKGASK